MSNIPIDRIRPVIHPRSREREAHAMFRRFIFILAAVVASGLFANMNSAAAAGKKPPAPKTWQIGEPIVTYWAGPPMTDATAVQMKEGGWNLVWCAEKELDTARRHGLRAMLQDGLSTRLAGRSRQASHARRPHRPGKEPPALMLLPQRRPNTSVFRPRRLTEYLRQRVRPIWPTSTFPHIRHERAARLHETPPQRTRKCAPVCRDRQTRALS